MVLENTTNQLVSDPADQVLLGTPDQLVLCQPGTVGTPLDFANRVPTENFSDICSDRSSESEKDSRDENIDIQGFCANCMRGPGGVSLSSPYYCSIKLEGP